ncbi:hypothetical protein PC129_g13815 [Phytophthora cactorum]|uniref:Integrase catalytic domain-containing protein n=1 Tax=Phytophthora cactorum TaxID=29920 RepID=A0A329RV70_9STRA|nr:hypothetical protein Pcac1_g4891 [Phytophthora cactorum]KAG2886130.1 hypothetical protein PC114_g19431 [Phytophthora cactorum]KAG2912493.1 hypothetical protein PC117_g18881 [Phytophthora cactorum]KAG3005107.1 hypothetical protein PC120_g18185 [Phytophthora cactorum]KAG3021254.1 hypothetical protein PC119_g9673 [Phytophthora cactorum]
MIDNGSSFNKVHLLKRKDEAAEYIRLFIAEFERQCNLPVKYLRADGGGEFFSRRFQGLLASKGIIHQYSEADTSASNGKAKRFHRTPMDSARAMLWASTLPERFWGDAVLYTSYIRNRLPARSNPDLQTPLENLTGKPPSVAHILKFGSKCTLHLANKKGKSLRK